MADILATKIKKLRDIHITLDPPQLWCGWGHPAYEKTLNSWARELEEFIRDHRSQDQISINIIRETYDTCSVCGREWEVYNEDDGSIVCSNCGAIIEEAKVVSDGR
jgi:transposase